MFWRLIYWLRMPIIALFTTLGYYFYKNNLMLVPHPSQIELTVSEVVYKSQEVVALYWEKHHKCPTAEDIQIVQLLPLVANVEVGHATTMSCKLIIQLKKEDIDKAIAGKIIEQNLYFRTSLKSDEPYQWRCYTDAAKESVNSNCRQFRNIDYYLHNSSR